MSKSAAARIRRLCRIHLIADAHPSDTLTATGPANGPQGTQFLNLLASRASDVLGAMSLTSPTTPHPAIDSGHRCSFRFASPLRFLRAKIRSVWPEAKIYHDRNFIGAEPISTSPAL
jgi:hypothetical protein